MWLLRRAKPNPGILSKSIKVLSNQFITPIAKLVELFKANYKKGIALV